jgi:hypothetical protein
MGVGGSENGRQGTAVEGVSVSVGVGGRRRPGQCARAVEALAHSSSSE